MPIAPATAWASGGRACCGRALRRRPDRVRRHRPGDRLVLPVGREARPVFGDRGRHEAGPEPGGGRWRLWGSGDLVRWYNLDGNPRRRPRSSSWTSGGGCVRSSLRTIPTPWPRSSPSTGIRRRPRSRDLGRGVRRDETALATVAGVSTAELFDDDAVATGYAYDRPPVHPHLMARLQSARSGSGRWNGRSTSGAEPGHRPRRCCHSRGVPSVSIRTCRWCGRRGAASGARCSGRDRRGGAVRSRLGGPARGGGRVELRRSRRVRAGRRSGPLARWADRSVELRVRPAHRPHVAGPTGSTGTRPVGHDRRRRRWTRRRSPRRRSGWWPTIGSWPRCR